MKRVNAFSIPALVERYMEMAAAVPIIQVAPTAPSRQTGRWINPERCAEGVHRARDLRLSARAFPAAHNGHVCMVR